jgi:hypothetical protein
MYSDSEPETSPFTKSDLPMVACSPLGTTGLATVAAAVLGVLDS